MEKRNKSKIILLIMLLLTTLNSLFVIMLAIIDKFQNRKNVFKKITFVKEYELTVPKNITKKEINELINDMATEDENAVAYSWKSKSNKEQPYIMKKIKKSS